ncbi:hypothetical protein EC973_006095 [Apophysomyces ossiformis]|uniref:Uncharacterized protein n=1 Tax=Apophysomyces ossiformis TaxID=679940 RepID=A0A8H7BVK2_9FUNG|nr:hypothetical protein EC973_006095 [Apophysomyces ossiformis]
MEAPFPQQQQQEAQITAESIHRTPHQPAVNATQPTAFPTQQQQQTPSGSDPSQGSGGIFQGFKRLVREAVQRPQQTIPPPPGLPFHISPLMIPPLLPPTEDQLAQQHHPASMMMPTPTTPVAGMPYTPGAMHPSIVNPYPPIQTPYPPAAVLPNAMMSHYPYPFHQQPYPYYQHPATMMPFGNMYEPNYHYNHYPEAAYPYHAYPYHHQSPFGYAYPSPYGMMPGHFPMPYYDPNLFSKPNYISAVKDLWQSNLV